MEELNVQKGHIHLLVSVPPQGFHFDVMGTLKGKIAIKVFPKLKQNPYWGNHFWARGYFVSTVGLDGETIRRYVKYQGKEEKKVEDQQQRFDF